MRKLRRKSPTLEEVKDEFITDCKCRGLADCTIKAYHYNLTYFNDYLQEKQITLSDLSNSTINSYKIYLMEHTNRNTISINTVLRHVSTYLKWLHENAYINDYIRVKYVRGQAEPKEIYSDEEIKKLLRKPKIDNCSYAELRTWAIINVLVSTGIRRSSLVNIRLVDIDWQDKIIRLTHTKNKQIHFVSMSQSLEKTLRLWLRYRIENKNDYLFTTQTGDKLMASSLTNNIYRFNKSRGVDVTSVHAFRHYFAIKMIENNVDIYTISKLLGHSDLSTTQIYLKSLNQMDYVKNNSIDVLGRLLK